MTRRFKLKALGVPSCIHELEERKRQPELTGTNSSFPSKVQPNNFNNSVAFTTSYSSLPPATTILVDKSGGTSSRAERYYAPANRFIYSSTTMSSITRRPRNNLSPRGTEARLSERSVYFILRKLSPIQQIGTRTSWTGISRSQTCLS